MEQRAGLRSESKNCGESAAAMSTCGALAQAHSEEGVGPSGDVLVSKKLCTRDSNRSSAVNTMVRRVMPIRSEGQA